MVGYADVLFRLYENPLWDEGLFVHAKQAWSKLEVISSIWGCF